MNASNPRSRAGAILLVALWFGIAAGLLEGLTWWLGAAAGVLSWDSQQAAHR